VSGPRFDASLRGQESGATLGYFEVVDHEGQNLNRSSYVDFLDIIPIRKISIDTALIINDTMAEDNSIQFIV
jgi:hypothetical protein